MMTAIAARRVLAPLAIVSVMVMSACNTADTSFGPKTGIGAALGAAGGGLVGAAAGGGGAGIAAGVLLGGLTGGAVGSYMDDQDRRTAAINAQTALETTPAGMTSTWRNPDTGVTGSTTPTRTFQNASGQPCREFEQSVTIEGKPERSYGVACRQPDGSWKIVSGS